MPSPLIGLTTHPVTDPDRAELDLLLFRGSERVGVEIKRADAPRVTHSNHIVLRDLKLDRLYIVYPGWQRYRLAENVEVVPLTALLACAA